VRGKLALTTQRGWQDKNDIFTIECFKALTGRRAVRICCLADTKNTFHHWKVFCPAKDGVCVVFKTDMLSEALESKGVFLRSMHYINIVRLGELGRIDPAELPYLKWDRYQDEREYRALWSRKKEMGPDLVRSIQIPAGAIESIIVSPLISERRTRAIIEQLKGMVAAYQKLKRIKILRSGTRDSSKWRMAVLKKLSPRPEVEY
jgi:hypothetical protein